MPSKKERVTITLEDWAVVIVKDLAGPFGAPASVVKQLAEERLNIYPHWKVGDVAMAKHLRLWMSLPEQARSEALSAAIAQLPPKQAARLMKEIGIDEPGK